MFTANAEPLMLPAYQVQDIDTLVDWTHAELMYATLATRVSGEYSA